MPISWYGGSPPAPALTADWHGYCGRKRHRKVGLWPGMIPACPCSTSACRLLVIAVRVHADCHCRVSACRLSVPYECRPLAIHATSDGGVIAISNARHLVIAQGPANAFVDHDLQALDIPPAALAHEVGLEAL